MLRVNLHLIIISYQIQHKTFIFENFRSESWTVSSRSIEIWLRDAFCSDVSSLNCLNCVKAQCNSSTLSKTREKYPDDFNVTKDLRLIEKKDNHEVVHAAVRKTFCYNFNYYFNYYFKYYFKYWLVTVILIFFLNFRTFTNFLFYVYTHLLHLHTPIWRRTMKGCCSRATNSN